MKRLWLPLLLACAAPLMQAQTPDAPKYEVSPVPNVQAEHLLGAMIPKHKKFVVIKPFVVSTERKVVDLGMSCSSSSTGTVSGTVNDNGDVDGTTHTHGSTNCSEQHNYYYTLKLGLPDNADPKAIYVITAQCVEKWVWNHCDMPQKGQFYPVVLEREKHGAFDVYAATMEKLGSKSKVARFAVLGVEHVEVPKQDTTPTQ